MKPEEIKAFLNLALPAEIIIGIQTNTAFWEEYNHFCTELIRAYTDSYHTVGAETNIEVEVKYWTGVKRCVRGDSFYPKTLFDGT